MKCSWSFFSDFEDAMVIVITTLDLDSSNHENDQGVGLILRPCQFAIVLPIGNTNIDIYIPSDPEAESDHCRLAVTLCRQVGIEHCLQPDQTDPLSPNNISDLLTALYDKFSQASPQPASRPSVSGKDPGLGDSLSSLTSSQDWGVPQPPAKTTIDSRLTEVSHHRSCESLVRENLISETSHI